MRNFKLSRVLVLLAGIIISSDLSAQKDTLKTPTQFLFPEFAKATVIFKIGMPQTALMNYNLLSGKMVYQQNNKLLDMINTEMVDTIFLQNKKFIPFEKIFLEVALDTAIPLYFQHTGSLIAPGKPAAYGGTSQTSSVTSISTLYGGGSTYNLKLPSDYTVKKDIVNWTKVYGVMQRFYNERQFLKIFKNNNEAKIRQFVKENRIRFNDQDELIRLFIFCNEL